MANEIDAKRLYLNTHRLGVLHAAMRALIAIDDQARFRNDVQLDLFDDPEENLALLRSFAFTVAAPGNTRVLNAGGLLC